MKLLIHGLAGLVLLSGLASCQTPQESAQNAEMTCSAQGFKPGTARYRRCVGATYNSNRQQAKQAESNVAAGAAIGVLGGAVLGASLDRHPHYYHRCGPWGCYY
ncbi:hypothetical protein [Allorhizobium taibaishanense]|uniref:Glycine zipper domain-containing protein n=1 Tax=Allorhizobium taibaishanense TaxID=887144 RepID=A0A1Q9AAN6_9HYPH|nr:hypothetical protein [Allorhizobium taibaishanense]MBB4007150.1 hypothetical protein [Allorhizobium taibaishanense]OLP51936.1 hypothetical protein BJF91_23785 [Allorhizobium taibaishanense]